MHDIVIIGGGPGGYVCAIRAAQNGLSVALVEKGQLGGTCLNRGCIPTKALAHTADVMDAVSRGADLGLVIPEARVDFARVMARKDRVVARLRGGVGLLLKRRKIDVLSGVGTLAGTRAVEATALDGSTTRLEARNIVIATGSEPIAPRMFGYDGVNMLTSEDVLKLKELPESMLIVGAGVIGCEFASIFRAFGCEVTLVDIMPSILPMVDDDVAAVVRTAFAKRGIKIHTGTKITEVKVADGRVEAACEDGKTLAAEKGVLSVGRRSTTGGVGASDVGVETGNSGEIVVDSRMRTNVAGIWAIGDVTGKSQLAHVASAQGLAVAANAAGQNRSMEYYAVPNCIFTNPEIAVVGVSERSALESGIDHRVGKFPFLASGKAMAMGAPEGFVKIIVDSAGRVIGGQVVGAHASDLIAEIALAVSRRLKLEDIEHTIHAHPTLAESTAEAAEAVMGRAIHI